MYEQITTHGHILVVDDDESIREILKRTIKIAGYECTTAQNVKEALNILENNQVDVVITDIVMEGQNGIELTSIVKEKFDADVIMITGFSEDLKYEDAIKLGARDFIQKPVSSNEVLVRLKRVLIERSILAERYRAEEDLKENIRKLNRLLEEIVGALISAMESRDPYTSGHQKRVTKLACSIASEMGLEENIVKGIRMAGLLHDIGKMSIPADILNKPGKVTELEFNLIKEHTTVGYNILKDIEFERPIAQIVLQHHERMNGSGYPQCLYSEEILIEAKILGVADVVEGMASHRPYRPSLGIDAALDEILQNKAVIYDQIVVDTCLKLFNKKGFTLD